MMALRSVLSRPAAAAAAQQTLRRAFSAGSVSVDLSRSFDVHSESHSRSASLPTSADPHWRSLPWRMPLCGPDLDSTPPKSATATKEELLDYLKLMYTMRRMEITCDTEYKVGHG